MVPEKTIFMVPPTRDLFIQVCFCWKNGPDHLKVNDFAHRAPGKIPQTSPNPQKERIPS